MDENDYLFDAKRKDFEGLKLKKWVFAFLILLLLTGLASLGYYIFAQFKPINIYKMAIREAYNYIEASYELDENGKSIFDYIFKNDKYKMDMTGTVEVFDEKSTISYSLQANFDIDPIKQEENIYLGLFENETKILDMNAFTKNHRDYIKMDALFDKIIDIGEDEDYDENSEDMTLTTSKELLDIYKASKDYLDQSLKEEYFTQSKGKLNANGIIREVNKYTLTITKEIAENLAKGYISYMEEKIKNNEIVDDNDLHEYIEELKNYDYSQFKTTTINIYCNIRNIQGIDIEQDGNSLLKFYYMEGALEASILDCDEYCVTKEDFEENTWKFLGATKDEKLTMRILLGKEDQGKVTIEELNNHKISFTYTINTFSETGPIEGAIKIEEKSTLDETQANYKMNLEMLMKIGNEEMKITEVIEFKTLEEVITPELTQVVNIDNLTPEESYQILSNVQNLGKGTSLEPFFKALTALTDQFTTM